MRKRILTLTLIIFALAVVGAAEALQAERKALQSKVVAIDVDDNIGGGKQECAQDDETMDACRSFIKGFLQGALLTDTAIIESIEDNESSYSERALRTRLGKRSSSPTALAGFCLPADRTILELAQETLDHVKYSERNSVELAQNVYKSLKVDYPCDE